MSPRGIIRLVGNTSAAPPLSPPPLQMDSAIFQAAITADVAAAMAQINTNGTNRTGHGTNSSNQG